MVGLPRAIASSAMDGKNKKVDRFEKEKIAFHNDVRAAYLEIAKNEPGRVKIVDSEKQSINDIHEQIKNVIKNH